MPAEGDLRARFGDSVRLWLTTLALLAIPAWLIVTSIVGSEPPMADGTVRVGYFVLAPGEEGEAVSSFSLFFMAGAQVGGAMVAALCVLFPALFLGANLGGRRPPAAVGESVLDDAILEDAAVSVSVVRAGDGPVAPKVASSAGVPVVFFEKPTRLEPTGSVVDTDDDGTEDDDNRDDEDVDRLFR